MQTNERILVSRNKREGHYWRNMHGNHMRCRTFQVKPLKITWDKWYSKL